MVVLGASPVGDGADLASGSQLEAEVRRVPEGAGRLHDAGDGATPRDLKKSIRVDF